MTLNSNIPKLKEDLFTNENFLFDTPEWTYGMYKKMNGVIKYFKILKEVALKPSGRKVVTRLTYTDPQAQHHIKPFLSEDSFWEELDEGKIERVYQCNRTTIFQRRHDTLKGFLSYFD